MPEQDRIGEILQRSTNIAVIGLTNNPERPAYGVSRYMQQQGYRIIPVNPKGERVHGETGYKSLSDIPDQVDIVDVFRRPDAVPEIVEEVIALKLPTLWLQESVIHEEAANKARQAGVFVVMDRCILKEYRARREQMQKRPA